VPPPRKCYPRSHAGKYWLGFTKYWCRLRLTRHIGFWKNFNSGFTLAEVLITLGIIGVVAAVTMPTLISKHNEKVMITRLSKMYSLLGNAYERAVLENGEVPNWFSGEDMTENNKIVSDILMKHLSVVKTCEDDRYNKCLSKLYYLSGTNESHCQQKNNVGECTSNVLNDGSIITILGANNSVKGSWIYTDLNGKRGPNVFGKDVFRFMLTPRGILPDGKIAQDNKFGVNILDNYSNHCLDKEKYTRGFGCTSWVIINQNMDYLRCPNDLSYDGKTQCK